MSKIGKKPINIPQGADVSIREGFVSVKGPKGTLEKAVPSNIVMVVEDNKLKIKPIDPRIKYSNVYWGLARSLAQNMIIGVTDGFEKVLEFQGVGYKANVKGNDLELGLGFSHPVTLAAPEGIAFEVKDNKISVSGVDKAVVGQIAANIRGLKPADPYKTKGFKYEDEIIIKKPGKAAKAGGVAGGAK